MIPANKPLMEKAKTRWDLFEACPHAKDDTCSCCDKCLKEKWILLNDVLAKVKELKNNLMKIYQKGSWIIPKTNTPMIPYLAVQREIDSVFGEDTQAQEAAAKKEMPCKVADTIEASSSKPSPSQNSQCKGCNQDFEGQHRSYCPTLKDRTRKARR